MSSLLTLLPRAQTWISGRKIGGLFISFLSFFACFLQAGKRVGKALHAPLMKLLEQEESLGKKRQKVGFLG